MTRFVTRYDRAPEPLGPPKKTAEGYLFADGKIARPGIYVYLRADGSKIRELVPLTTLVESAPTMQGKPITLRHPPVPVGPNNVAEYGTGFVDLRDDGQHAAIKVHRADALTAIDDGMTQLSPGYVATIDDTPGVDPEFGEYDSIQIARHYNHLAIVDTARGGPVCAIRLDGVEATEIGSEEPPGQAAPAQETDPRVDALERAGVTAETIDALINDAAFARRVYDVAGELRGDALFEKVRDALKPPAPPAPPAETPKEDAADASAAWDFMRHAPRSDALLTLSVDPWIAAQNAGKK